MGKPSVLVLLEALEKTRPDTKKKTTLYQEPDDVKRAYFKEYIATITLKTLVYVDKAGVDNGLFRAFSRVTRGQKIYANIFGKKREYRMMGGLMNHKFMAPLTFQGGCNADVFNAWLETILLPELPPNTIIMDNAAFHKSPKTPELIEADRCFLLFLPAYSPDFNPIEHCWHTVKSRDRPLIQNNQENVQEIIGCCL